MESVGSRSSDRWGSTRSKRWLTARDVGIGTLTIGARTKRRLSDGDLVLLDAAAARLGNAPRQSSGALSSSTTAPSRWLG